MHATPKTPVRETDVTVEIPVRQTACQQPIIPAPFAYPEANKMSYVLSLIDRTKDFLPRKTDYALCQALGISYSDLRKTRAGKGFSGPKQRMRIHEITGIPLDDVTAMIETERSKKPDDKEFWAKRLPRISAACIVTQSLLAATYHGNSGIASASLPLIVVDPFIHYAKVYFIGTILALLVLPGLCATAPGAAHEFHLTPPSDRQHKNTKRRPASPRPPPRLHA